MEKSLRSLASRITWLVTVSVEIVYLSWYPSWAYFKPMGNAFAHAWLVCTSVSPPRWLIADGICILKKEAGWETLGTTASVCICAESIRIFIAGALVDPRRACRCASKNKAPDSAHA